MSLGLRRMLNLVRRGPAHLDPRTWLTFDVQGEFQARVVEPSSVLLSVLGRLPTIDRIYVSDPQRRCVARLAHLRRSSSARGGVKMFINASRIYLQFRNPKRRASTEKIKARIQRMQ